MTLGLIAAVIALILAIIVIAGAGNDRVTAGAVALLAIAVLVGSVGI